VVLSVIAGVVAPILSLGENGLRTVDFGVNYFLVCVAILILAVVIAAFTAGERHGSTLTAAKG
jgi:hypothetical protein